MANLLRHIRKNVLRGLLALVPLILSYFVIRFLYVAIDRKFSGILDQFLGFHFPGTGILLLLFFFYVVGIVATKAVGRQFLSAVERLSNRIPLVRTAYSVGKQLSETFSSTEKQTFKRVVLLRVNPTLLLVGFVTGSLENAQDRPRYLRVFVPTTPNPTSGFVILVKEADTADPGWSVEEGLRAVLSGGVIGPAQFRGAFQ